MNRLQSLVEDYKNFKVGKGLDESISKKEYLMLRKSLREDASKQGTTNDLSQLVENYKKFKAEKGLDESISKKEYIALRAAAAPLKEDTVLSSAVKDQALKESVKPLNDIGVVISNYKKVKESRLGTSKISYKEVKTLREAVKDANAKGKRLAEADENFMAAPATDPNAGVDPTAPAAGTCDDAQVKTQIQTLLQQVEALAASVGVQTSDLSGDASSDIPAVTGQNADAAQPPVDPAVQQMNESVKKVREANNGVCDEEHFAPLHEAYCKTLDDSDKTRDRIAMRQAKLDHMTENCKEDFADSYMKHSGLREKVEQITTNDVPAAKTLANGYTSGPGAKDTKPASRWPTKKIAEEPLQGKGVSMKNTAKIKESTEAPSVSDKYVENFYEPKLDFQSLKEAFKSNLIG